MTAVLGVGLLAACTAAPSPPPGTPGPKGSDHGTAAHDSPVPPTPHPLAGRTVVVDAGHQLGNAEHLRQIQRLVDAGGFEKPCNTTGTQTDDGYPEATFTFAVAQRLARLLRSRGARVTMTRDRNSERLWGPCVDVRGTAGNATGHRRGADAKVSIHGDGSAGGGRGFHVIVPARPATHGASERLGEATGRALRRHGFETSTYVATDDGMVARDDLATLNLSRTPAVMVELGNMRDAHDAAVMRSARGQRRYARALARGVQEFLRR